MLWVAAAIFLLTFLLISLRQVARFPLDRPAAAIFGAALMLIFGVLSPEEALASINLDVLLLLVGMMLLVGGLEVCGFFDWVSAHLARQARSQRVFLVGFMVATAILSALVLNDTIALLMTPIVVRTTRALGVNPIPYLVSLAIAVNVGSVATEVGNPQNAYIGIRSGIPFLEFTAAMLPVMVASLGVSIVLVWAVFRRELGKPMGVSEKAVPVQLQRHGLLLTLVITAMTVGAFSLSGPQWLPFVALAGGALVLFGLPFVSTATPRALIEKVDWSIILFFIGLFVVMGGVRTSGLAEGIEEGFTDLFGARAGGLAWLTGLSALLSNLISNVPAVLLLSEVVDVNGGSTQLWLGLAASSTLAGNATILGAAANVIVVQMARREGVDVSMREFVKAGLPVTIATLVLSTALLAVLVPA